jgi:hypothetical protein
MSETCRIALKNRRQRLATHAFSQAHVDAQGAGHAMRRGADRSELRTALAGRYFLTPAMPRRGKKDSSDD